MTLLQYLRARKEKGFPGFNWKNQRLFAAGAVAVLALFSAVQGYRGNTLYINGKVLTLDQDNRIVQAVAVKKGRILAVGSDAEILAEKNLFSRVVDLEGRTMMPGFVDAHSHFPGSGLKAFMAGLNSPPIGTIHNIADIQDALRTRMESARKKDWIAGNGYDDTLLAEKRHPTREDLDQVSADRPIFILHISGHLAVANSRTLQIAGIDENSPDPEGGVIRRDASGRPTGVLEEKAVDMVQALMPLPSAGDLIETVRISSQDYISHGVTTAQNGLATKTYCLALGIASKLGMLPLRVVVWPDEDTGRAMVEGDFKPGWLESERFHVGAVKLIDDGSIQGYTGYLSKPYYVIPEDKDQGYRGYPVIPRDKLAEKVEYFHKAGMQIAIHGNGDAAIDDILNAFGKAEQAYPREDARHIIIHAQMAREDQLDLMQKLGVIPSFFVLHTYYWGDRHRDIFMGPERAARMSPCKSALNRGTRFTIHTDSPVVPMEPLRLAWSAVNRISYGGSVIGPEQRIDTMQALRAETLDAAWQMFLEDSRGSIEPGKMADLIILSADPLADPAKLEDVKVLETIVGGKTVFKAED